MPSVVTLESVHLFQGLTPEEIRALRGITRETDFAPGAEIFREGDSGDGVYIVKDGLVEISARLGGNPRKVLSQLGPGEIFGEMAVIEEQPRSATATSVKNTRVYFIPRREMLRLLQRSPGLSLNVLQEISRRLRDFNQLHLREAVQAERLAVLGTFARSIIHDLKTPLTIIGLSAEIGCAPHARPETRAQSQERIRKQVRRINDLVGDILEFTRTHRAPAALVPAEYGDFIGELLPEIRAECEAHSVRVQLRTEPPPGKVFLDAGRLRRVFFNLIDNALHVMLEGGEIFLDFQADGREMVTEIEDTGPGVAPQIAGKLFEPFVTHGKAQGTGLGLSICKKIVEDHKGRIWARAEPGRGAIFCFSLPLAK